MTFNRIKLDIHFPFNLELVKNIKLEKDLSEIVLYILFNSLRHLSTQPQKNIIFNIESFLVVKLSFLVFKQKNIKKSTFMIKEQHFCNYFKNRI